MGNWVSWLHSSPSTCSTHAYRTCSMESVLDSRISTPFKVLVDSSHIGPWHVFNLPCPALPHHPTPSKAPLNWVARLIPKAQKVSWTRKEFHGVPCKSTTCHAAIVSMIPLVPIAKNPKHLETKRNWLQVCRSLVSGPVYTVTLFLLT